MKNICLQKSLFQNQSWNMFDTKIGDLEAAAGTMSFAKTIAFHGILQGLFVPNKIKKQYQLNLMLQFAQFNYLFES